MAGLLHHVAEEWDVTDDRIRRIFGDLVADGVDTVTKTYRGHRQDDTTLFERMAENPISSVARPADRATNHGSMVLSEEVGRVHREHWREVLPSAEEG